MSVDYLYSRASSDTQTCESQLPELEKWAAQNCEGTPFWVSDIATGRNMNRKGMQSIIKAISSGQSCRLVVVSINRLGRNVRQVMEVVELCDKHKTPLISLREGIDSATPMGRCMIAMLAALAQLENEQRSSATKAGIAAKREYCLKNVTPFKHGGSAKGHSLKVTKIKAQAILALHKAGNSYRQIAKEVCLSDKTVRQVVLNPREFYYSRKKLAELNKIHAKGN